MAKAKRPKQKQKAAPTANSNNKHKLNEADATMKGSPRSILEYLFPVVAVLCIWRGDPLQMSDWDWGAPTALLSRWITGGASSSSSGMDDVIDVTSLPPIPEPSDLEEALTNHNTIDTFSCRFVMSHSLLPADHAGWGVFSLVDLDPNDKLLYSDMRIQLVDVQNHQYEGLAHLLYNYSWQAKYGIAEGSEVQSVVPGMSMLTNMGFDNQFQAVPNVPYPPEPGNDTLSTRGSPSAGSFTHYHNRQFFTRQAVSKGQELLVSYGTSFANEKLGHAKGAPVSLGSLQRPVAELQKEGMCLDNIVSGPTVGRGGRGAFATRSLAKGSMVAPVPVVSVNRTSLDMYAGHIMNKKKQLLLNYCYGHPNSTLLLFPYSPVVNYINSIHYTNDINNQEQPNAILQWSDRAWKLEESQKLSAQQIHGTRRWGLLLEVVALRDIAKGEQILIDYGPEWHQAWEEHRQHYNDSNTAASAPYVYASRLNQLSHVRTEEEQTQNPYPGNVETSCIYQYSETTNYNLWPNSEDKRNRITHNEWPKKSRIIPDYVRPCRVLTRSNHDNTYTVEVHNQHVGAETSAGRIPRGERHVVTEMPRAAIQFTDKVYSTDQNLASAFRHEIGLPEGVFPSPWMDLA